MTTDPYAPPKAEVDAAIEAAKPLIPDLAPFYAKRTVQGMMHAADANDKLRPVITAALEAAAKVRVGKT